MNVPVWMYIDKFDREVLIDPDHPLAVAQVKRDAERSEQTQDELPPELKPVVEVLKEPVAIETPVVTPPPATVKPAATKPKKKR